MKVKRKLMAFVLASGSLAFTYCGDNDGGDDDGPAEEAKEEALALINGWELMGKWRAECHGTELFDKSVQTSYKFKEDDLTKTYLVYDSEDCTGDDKIAVLTFLGEFKIKEDPQDREDYRAIDLKYNKVTAKINSEIGADFFSTLNFCGVDKWPLDESIDLTKASKRDGCPLPDIPATSYDLIKVDDGTLYFGAKELELFSNSEQRPEKINKDRKFKKEEK